MATGAQPSSPVPPADVTVQDVTLAEIFLGFFTVSAIGFGGVLPWARRMIVEQRHWLTPAEFTDLMGLCQFLPGPNIVNMAICLGSRFRGPLGSVVAVLSLLSAPFTIVLLLALVYARYGQLEMVRGALVGISASAAGLILSIGFKMALPVMRELWMSVIVVLVFIAVGIFHWPLLPVLAVFATAGVLASWLIRW